MTAEERQRLVEYILSFRDRFRQLIGVGPPHDWANAGLTMPQLKVLFLLYRSGTLTMGQLAEPLGVTLSTVTGIMDRLVEQELVNRQEAPRDRRVVVSVLTDKGNQLVERLYIGKRTHVVRVLERLTVEELRTLAKALDVIYAAVLAERQDQGDEPQSAAASSTQPRRSNE